MPTPESSTSTTSSPAGRACTRKVERAAALATVLQRVTRIAQQVAEDLDELVAVEGQGSDRVVFASHRHVRRVREMNRDGVVEQLGNVYGLGYTAAARVRLLCGHDAADVSDVSRDRGRLVAQLLVLGEQVGTQLGEIAGHLASTLVVLDEPAGLIALRDQQVRHPLQVADTGIFQPRLHERR